MWQANRQPGRNGSGSGGVRNRMIETIAIILLILWVLGFVSGTFMGGLIHVLLVVAIVMILARVIQGRRPV